MGSSGRDQSDPTCWAFVKGNCRKGNRCKWLHQSRDDRKNDTPSESSGSGKNTSKKVSSKKSSKKKKLSKTSKQVKNSILKRGRKPPMKTNKQAPHRVVNASENKAVVGKKRGWISTKVKGESEQHVGRAAKRARPVPRGRGASYGLFGGSGGWNSNKWVKKYTEKLRPTLERAQKMLGPDWWVYDPDSECFRHTTYRSYEFDPIFENPSFIYNPDTEQYYSEQTEKYYVLKNREYIITQKRTHTKQDYVEEFRNKLKEFLDVVSENGIQRSQLASQVEIWRTRQEKLYRKKHKMRAPCEELAEVTKELLDEHLGLIDHLGKRLSVKPPYTCPLCGRKSTDADTLLAHFRLHRECNKAGKLTPWAMKDKNPIVQALLESEVPNVIGDAKVQRVVREAMGRHGKNNGRRFHALNTLKRMMNFSNDELLGCDVVHPIRSAFPEAHGCYFGKHVCVDPGEASRSGEDEET